jgi:protein arginine N-methyltransferase 1
MYDLIGYLQMMEDRVRVPAYVEAIARVVAPGDVVLDLGAGLGLLSLLALRAGARRVYAVEVNDALDVARHVAATAGYGDQLVCHTGDSLSLSLPEPVDVIVSDLHGVLPLLGNSLQALVDARTRFLAPGGRMLPARERIMLAPVSCPAGAHNIEGWREPICGFDFSEAAALMANRWFRQPIGADGLLAPGQAFAEIDYATVEALDFTFAGRYVVEHAGRLDGLGGWFESELAPGVAMTSTPDAPPTVYKNAFFPLDRSHAVEPGDVVEVDAAARYADREHFFEWAVAVDRGDGRRAEEHHSEFLGEILNPDRIRRMAEFHTPELGEDGRVERAILESMDGRATLRELAERVAERFPERFASWRDAMPRVREVSRRFSV